MKSFSTRDIFGIFLALGTGLLALGSWQTFFVVALHPTLENILLIVLWFSSLGAVFFLGTVVWSVRPLQVAAALLVFAPSILFIRTWYHAIFVVCGILLGLLAIQLVQKEMEDRVRFHFLHNVRVGAFSLIFGLSLALSSAYFASIQADSWEELVPRFSVGEGTATALFKTVAYVYPDWKNLADEGITVDGFLLGLKKDELSGEQASEATLLSSGSAGLPALAQYLKQNPALFGSLDSGELSQELYLRAGRDQVASLVGKPVRGDEKMADVFSSALQHKIITVLNGEQVSQHLTPTIVPFMLALFLFLTLLPVGSFLALFWIALGFALFRVVLLFGWVKVDRVMREQEILLP